MKISIITPTLNSARTVRDTLDSILVQTYKDFECIIVDSGSTDATLEIIKEYQKLDSRIHILQNEDTRLYFSINEGAGSASGEIITILNSDDFYNENSVLENVILSFQNENTDACYGDMLVVKHNKISKILRYWKSGLFDPALINSGWSPPHPTLFIKKEIYNQIGLYKVDFKIAGDYELMLRLMKTEDVSFSYIPKILVRMRNNGKSNNSIRARTTGWKELRKAWVINGYKVPAFFITRRLLSKIGQYL